MVDMKSEIQMKVVEYRCTRCGAIDHGKFFPEEPIAHCINCWNCHAGFQMSPDQMMQTQTGMFPVAPEVAPSNAEGIPA